MTETLERMADNGENTMNITKWMSEWMSEKVSEWVRRWVSERVYMCACMCMFIRLYMHIYTRSYLNTHVRVCIQATLKPTIKKNKSTKHHRCQTIKYKTPPLPNKQKLKQEFPSHSSWSRSRQTHNQTLFNKTLVKPQLELQLLSSIAVTTSSLFYILIVLFLFFQFHFFLIIKIRSNIPRLSFRNW